jgi:hypothetical protein
MAKLGSWIAFLFVGLAGMALIIEWWAEDWSERAAMAAGFGASGLLAALPGLRRHDEDSDRAFVVAVGAVVALVASAVIALYVVHSWAWLWLALAYFLVVVAFEMWDRYQESRSPRPGIEQDIEEKQRRQDEQLQKTFFHG